MPSGVAGGAPAQPWAQPQVPVIGLPYGGASIPQRPQRSWLALSITAAAVAAIGLIVHIAMFVAMQQATGREIGVLGGLTIILGPVGGTVSLVVVVTALILAIRSRRRASVVLASCAMAAWVIAVVLVVATVATGMVHDGVL